LPRPELPSGTVTFLFTDIAGSTKLLHELGAERYAGALAEHRTVLRQAFSRHGGVEVDTQGDAFFVAFPTAPGALAAAREAQEGLSIPVRMGLHTGTPLMTEEGYVGPDVHRATRIAAAGYGRQVLVSASTHALLDPSNSPLLDLGEHRLKDLSAPERIYQAGDGEFPMLKTLYATNLPVPTTPFLGRERELAEVSDLFVRGGVRLLTLSGPGGTGKTRLALQAAAAAAEAYPDGIWWVPLAPLADSALVLPTAGEVLGAKGEFATHVGGKRLLLLLDNFEHLIEAAREVGALLGACPQLTVLVTSRERLQIAGEHEYAVPALAPPDGLALFTARAAALGAEFDGDEAGSELCERLDNLPLALELAAARTKLFSPAQLLERLGQRLDLFKGGRDADPRQRTLRATIEWSHDLLTPEEQRLFARLSVFAGGCTYEAAEAICEADEDRLQSLLDKSLLRRRTSQTGEPRYWMLETIREFAAERLHELDAGESVARAHAVWYADLAERLQEPFRDGDPDATAQLAAEVDNVRSALQWLADHGDAREGLKIVWGLWYFWVTRGLGAEGLRWADWALTAAPKAPPRDRTFGLLAASELLRMFGDAGLALRLKRQLVADFREQGNESRVASTLADMAEMYANQGDFYEARRLSDEAIALRRRLGEPFGISHALVNRGMVEFLAGDFGRARGLFEEAITFAEEPNVPASLAHAVLMAGESARRAGDVAAAVPLLRRALSLFGELGHRAAFPELLQEVAAVSHGRPASAVTLLGASEHLLAEMEWPRWDPVDYAQTSALLRAELGDEAFEEDWTTGAGLTADEALSLAVRCLDESLP
jgi:predicted ATPase